MRTSGGPAAAAAHPDHVLQLLLDDGHHGAGASRGAHEAVGDAAPGGAAPLRPPAVPHLTTANHPRTRTISDQAAPLREPSCTPFPESMHVPSACQA